MISFNIDEEAKTRFEDIELILDGKTYVITKITSDILETVGGGNANAGSLRRVLAGILGVSEKELRGTDVRKFQAAALHIIETLNNQIGGLDSKNAPGESAAQSPQ